MEESTDIKVSVIMLTYNHEAFLPQAIKGVLNQETNFNYELIIANDNSPDNTDELVKEIIKNHPKGNLIKYYKNVPNLGVMPNSKKALDSMRGEYFAPCEGDDYWIDSQKLQKQVNFLENNSDFSICFHNTRIEFFEKSVPPYLLNADIEKDVFLLEDLIGEDEIWFMATASLMVRTEAFGKTPDWLTKSKSGDIPIIILAARKGKIKYLPDVMAVYRKHIGGISLTDYKDDEGFLRNRIFMYKMLNQETKFKFNKQFKKNIARYYLMLLSSKQYMSSYFRKLPIAFKYISLTYPQTSNFKIILRDHLLPPFVLKATRSIKVLLGLAPSK